MVSHRVYHGAAPGQISWYYDLVAVTRYLVPKKAYMISLGYLS